MTDPSRVAVVTGAAQGIGRRTAELLAERGFHIAILDLKEPRATIEAIEKHGGKVFAFTGDITREEIKAQHEAIEARTDTKIVRLEGKLDLVIQSVQAGRVETLESRNAVIASQRGVIANIWVGIAIVVAVIVAFFTVTPMYFDQGFHLRETITQEVN